MAGFLDRLGGLFGRKGEEPAPAAPEEASVAEAPAAVEEPAPVADVVADAVPVADQPVEAAAPEAAPEIAAAPAEPVAEVAPAAPVKSAEEIEEDRLWGEASAAWESNDFPRVTTLLDQLKTLQPESAAVLDEHIAAAQFNAASAVEQAGDLEGALFLFQDAQRRNPNLGEAGFAIERVQSAIAAASQPAPSEAPVVEASPAEERTYTVEDGDTLSAIAEKFYGDANSYPTIFDANRDQLDNPDVIQVGQVLRIP